MSAQEDYSKDADAAMKMEPAKIITHTATPQASLTDEQWRDVCNYARRVKEAEENQPS
jgi:hypothetical protein